MAVNNPFKITYAGQAVGGTSNVFQLYEPYVIEKSFERFRLIFDVAVVTASYSSLKSQSDTLETAFNKRMAASETLIIDINGNTWTYTSGTTILNATSTITKTGNPESDRGYSRIYTISIEGELPAADASPISGMRDIEWNVSYEAGRQRTVTARGTYTATESPAQLASVNYLHANGADAEATTFLAALSGSSTYELVDEAFTPDRQDHICNFTRQYNELTVNQVQGTLNSSSIADHRIVFTDLSQHPGDSKKNIYRLRRVIGSYDCAAVLSSPVTSTDIQTLFDDRIRPHVIALFETNFSPQVFAMEESRVAYDETTKRISVSLQFIYQKSGGDDVIEVAQSLAFRESRTIDYTYTHGKDELAAYADVGWATVERVASRTVIVLGKETPKRRIGITPGGFPKNPAGPIEGIKGGLKVTQSGWNIVQNTSQVTQQWLGDPDDDQIEVSILTETVVERLNNVPKRSAITPGR